jgi:hypothetical protein
MVNRPHPLAWFVALIVVIAVMAAIAVDAQDPSWALRSEWVYRAEVGAAIVGLLYLPLVALSLAWRGETFRRIQAPGGVAVETPAGQIGSAADEIARFEEQAEKRFRKLETAVDELNERVDKLQP